MSLSQASSSSPVSPPKPQKQRRFIVVEGPIGSGKSTLTKVLAPRLQAKLVVEEENPFLLQFFKDMEKHAFQWQVCSLLSRYQQQKEILQVDLFTQGVLADYLFTSEHIFAEQHLSQDEFILYDKLLRAMDIRAPIPDLVIYLQSKPEALYERLQKSGYEYGRFVPFDYLVDLANAYNSYFFRYNLSPLLVVNTERVDFLANDRYLHDLVEEIGDVKRGVQHFVPGD